MLTARLCTHRSEPHLHDTYTIAFMNSGTAAVKVRNGSCIWRPGNVFVANPYEVHEGSSVGELLEYEVFYPSVELVLEAAAVRKRDALLPRFSNPLIDDRQVSLELAEVLSAATGHSCHWQGMRSASTAIEESLIRFFRRHSHLLDVGMDRNDAAAVQNACRIMQETLDSPICLSSLAAQVGFSRYYFIRLFRKVTGLAPNVYLRQLRLAKARRLICAGYLLADAAVESGFADQAHLTREYKRVFGMTPGEISRDLVSHP